VSVGLDDPPARVLHTLTIDAALFLARLKAVVPHASEDPEETALHRVRVTVVGRVYVVAGSGYSGVVAACDKVIDPTGDIWSVDLLPGDVAEICRLFKPGKDEIVTLRIEQLADDRLSVTQGGALIDGRTFVVPTVSGRDQMPDWPSVIASHLGKTPKARALTEVQGRYWRAFIAGATALGDVLTMEPLGDNAPVLVRIGTDLVGLLMPHRYDDERRDQLDRNRDLWSGRLADARLADPQPSTD
jgi:hypothetical protein